MTKPVTTTPHIGTTQFQNSPPITKKSFTVSCKFGCFQSGSRSHQALQCLPAQTRSKIEPESRIWQTYCKVNREKLQCSSSVQLNVLSGLWLCWNFFLFIWMSLDLTNLQDWNHYIYMLIWNFGDSWFVIDELWMMIVISYWSVIWSNFFRMTSWHFIRWFCKI